MPFAWRVCYDVGGCNFVATERGRCDLSCMSSVGMLECESHLEFYALLLNMVDS